MTADKSEAVSKAELSRINRKHLFNTRFSSLSLPHSNFKSSGPCGNSSVSLGPPLLTFWIRSSMRIHGVVLSVKPEPMEADNCADQSSDSAFMLIKSVCDDKKRNKSTVVT